KDVTFKIKDTDAEADYEITINQGTLKPTVTFEGLTVTYDGTAKKLEATVTGLPEGFILTPAYTVTGSATTYNAAGYSDAGTYNYSVTFTHTDGNYAQYTTPSTATLQIDKAKVTGIVFEDAVKPEITGTTYTLEATGYPSWVTPAYSVTDEDGNPLSGTSFSAAGKYKFTATFTIDPAHVNNYEAIAPITKTLTISDKPEVEGAGNIVVEPTITATYNGSSVDYAAKNVPEGVDVSYTIEKDGKPFSGTDIINVGEYTVTVSFETGAAYAPIADKTCVVTVGKATVDMSGVKFADDTVTGNGQPHKFEATNLPEGVTVEYEYKGKKQTDPFEFTEVGEYTVKAYFTYEDEDNYETIKPVEATLTISDAVVESISANVEDGAKFDINGTLDDVKAKIKAEIHFNNETKADAKAEDLTITCATLREGGLLEVGTQTITVVYNDGTQDFTTTVQIEVAKAKVALPVYNGSLRYTGFDVKPAASDFEGFDSALMALVDSKTVAGLNAGAYKAVFALKDAERYEWATARTYKKTVFAAVVYEEVVLEDYEAAVDWNLAKAKITATKANG
ncbi:MAG: MBG domain-containing protein, partial [Clostridia bacterium]|nr:MBG domain-containing protein [Clostridia bacterium]